LIRHVEQARHHDGDAGGEAPRWRKEVSLAQSKGRDHHIGEKIDDQVETLAAPARQNPGDAEAPGERTVNAVDDQGHAKPDEHPPPIGLRGGDQRKKREGGAGRGSKVNRGGPQGRTHAASSTVCATRFAKSNGFEREERRVASPRP